MKARELMDLPDDDWPIAYETVCDTPEAVMAAVARLDGKISDATVIERDGKPVGALVSYQDFRGLLKLLWNREMDLDLAAIETYDRSERTFPWDEVKQELGL